MNNSWKIEAASEDCKVSLALAEFWLIEFNWDFRKTVDFLGGADA